MSDASDGIVIQTPQEVTLEENRPQLDKEDHDFIKSLLLAQREKGNENPLLPMDVDVDGDGVADSYGLDESGEVIVVRGTKLEDTLFVNPDDEPRVG